MALATADRLLALVLSNGITILSGAAAPWQTAFPTRQQVMVSLVTAGYHAVGSKQQRYAIVPLDGDMLDYLLERSPKFIEACRDIKGRVRAGNLQTHESAK